MFPKKLAWVAVAALGCGLCLGAEDSADVPLVRARSAAALSLAGAPIPQSPGTRTALDVERQWLEWDKRCLLPALHIVAKGKPWESDAAKFVEDSILARSGLNEENRLEKWTAVGARGEELLKSGCDELTVRYVAAGFKLPGNRVKRAAVEAEYRKILAQLENDPRYRRAFACQVAVALAELAPEPNAKLDKEIVDLRRQSFEEGSYGGADDALFVSQVLNTNNLMKHHGDAMEKLVIELPGLPDWARETILGEIEIDRAWLSRGNGWADSVTEEGWKGFRQGIDNARGHLTAAWKQRPDQPYAAAAMIKVTMGSEQAPTSDLRLWFDRTVKAQFDFMRAYDSYVTAILPRWGGSHDEMLAFGRACAATRRYDTAAPGRFISVVDRIGDELSRRREIYLLPSVSSEVMTVDKGYAAATNRRFDTNVALSQLAMDGWLCHQWADVNAALDQLPERKVVAAMRSRMLYFGTAVNNITADAMLYTGPAAQDYTKARELDKQGRYEEAAGYYAAILKMCADQPVPLRIITLFSKVNDTRIELGKGKWVDISPKIGDPDSWLLSTQAQWSVPKDGVLEVAGIGETSASYWHRPVGENYELRANVDFLAPPERARLFGVVLGESPLRPNRAVACQFYSDQKTKGQVYVTCEFRKSNHPGYDVELAQANRIQFQCWDGWVTLYLNGKMVFEKLRTAEATPSDHVGKIGFGGWKLGGGKAFRVTGIQVRSLKAEPAPPDGAEVK